MAGMAGRDKATLLTGAGELSFDILPPAGHLGVQLDGKPIGLDSPGTVLVKIGRGQHRVLVTTDAGHKGELRVEVTRPSYAVGITQSMQGKSSRNYRLEVRSLDAGGAAAHGGEGLRARTEPVVPAEGEGQPLTLTPTGTGTFSGEVEVSAGQTVRLTVTDADGTVASAELHGSQD